MTLKELLEQNIVMAEVFQTAIENKLKDDKSIVDIDVSHHSGAFEFYIEYNHNEELVLNGYIYDGGKELRLFQHSLGVKDNGGYNFFTQITGVPKRDFSDLINELILTVDIF